MTDWSLKRAIIRLKSQVSELSKGMADILKRLDILEKKSHTGPVVFGPPPVDGSGSDFGGSLYESTKEIDWSMPHPDGVRDINLSEIDRKGVVDPKRVRPRFGPEK